MVEITITVLILIISILLTIVFAQNDRIMNLSKENKYYFKPFYKNIPKGIYKYLPLFLLGISFLLYSISKHNWLSDEINLSLNKAAFAIFSSGVFAVVLKSIQFTGIFKEEISSVMLTPKFVENRKDLHVLWGNISKALYRQKFPLISEAIQKRILETYFPTKQEYYFKKFNTTINISEISSDFVIKYTQIDDIIIIPEKGKENITYTKSTEVSVNDDFGFN